MIAFFDADLIREVFLFAVRFVAALGGFVVGYALTGPVVTLLARLIFHKPMPQWSMAWCKVIGGFLVALLVFWLLPVGGWGPGGGGKGSGGGTGDGKGTGSGKVTATGSGKYTTDGKGGPVNDSGVLVIELLGPETADKESGKCYLINRQPPPADLQAVEVYLKQHRERITAMKILVVREQSVSHNDPLWVGRLQELAQQYGLKRPEPETISVHKH
jgi:hypothetical protein